jgi:hypothetical protein
VVEETHLILRRLATILALIGAVIWGLRIIYEESYWPPIPWWTLLWFAIALTVAALSVWPIRALAGFSLGLATAQTLFLFAWRTLSLFGWHAEGWWPHDILGWVFFLTPSLVLAAAICSTVAESRAARSDSDWSKKEAHRNLRRFATILALLGSAIWGWYVIDGFDLSRPSWVVWLFFAIALTVAALSVWPIRSLPGLSLGLATTPALVSFALSAAEPELRTGVRCGPESLPRFTGGGEGDWGASHGGGGGASEGRT